MRKGQASPWVRTGHVTRPSGVKWVCVKESHGTRLWEGAIWVQGRSGPGFTVKFCAYVHEGKEGNGATLMRGGALDLAGRREGLLEDEQFLTLEEALVAADALLAAKEAAYRLGQSGPSPSPP